MDFSKILYIKTKVATGLYVFQESILNCLIFLAVHFSRTIYVDKTERNVDCSSNRGQNISGKSSFSELVETGSNMKVDLFGE